MNQNRVLTIFGDPVEIVVSSRSTGNASCTLIQTCLPGGGPPPHVHQREDEVFHLVEGEYEMFDGASWTPLLPGKPFFAPRGHPHTFRNSGSVPGRLLVFVAPGGIDEYFAQIEPLSMPRDAELLTAISASYGLSFV